MKLFQNFRKTQEVNQAVIDRLDEEILAAANDSRVTTEDLIGLMDARRKVKLNGNEQGISPSDILKVVANVAIVGVMVGFEMSHIMNQKGTKFIKPL